jgi:hypothetical protein
VTGRFFFASFWRVLLAAVVILGDYAVTLKVNFFPSLFVPGAYNNV